MAELTTRPSFDAVVLFRPVPQKVVKNEMKHYYYYATRLHFLAL